MSKPRLGGCCGCNCNCKACCCNCETLNVTISNLRYMYGGIGGTVVTLPYGPWTTTVTKNSDYPYPDPDVIGPFGTNCCSWGFSDFDGLPHSTDINTGAMTFALPAGNVDISLRLFNFRYICGKQRESGATSCPDFIQPVDIKGDVAAWSGAASTVTPFGGVGTLYFTNGYDPTAAVFSVPAGTLSRSCSPFLLTITNGLGLNLYIVTSAGQSEIVFLADLTITCAENGFAAMAVKPQPLNCIHLGDEVAGPIKSRTYRECAKGHGPQCFCNSPQTCGPGCTDYQAAGDSAEE